MEMRGLLALAQGTQLLGMLPPRHRHQLMTLLGSVEGWLVPRCWMLMT